MKAFIRVIALASLAWAALLVTGCATQLPALVHDGYRKSAQESAVLRVGRFWVERDAGGSAILAGSVSRKSAEGDTSKSYLLVVLRDASGTELLSEKVGFEPQTLPDEWGPHAKSGTFRHMFPKFPANVAEISITAVD